MELRVGIALAEEGRFPVVEVILSERNLRSLLLDIENEENSVTRLTPSGLLIIRGETNEVHYAEREAGKMGEGQELVLAKCNCEHIEVGAWCNDCKSHKSTFAL